MNIWRHGAPDDTSSAVCNSTPPNTTTTTILLFAVLLESLNFAACVVAAAALLQYLCPIHVITFNLISILVTNYVQIRRRKVLLFSFEYNNLLPNLISK